MRELNQYVDNILIAIVGNKADLEAQRVRVSGAVYYCFLLRFRFTLILHTVFSDKLCCEWRLELVSLLQEVETSKAKAYADSIDAVFFETSAKTNANVFDLFTEISESCYLLCFSSK